MREKSQERQSIVEDISFLNISNLIRLLPFDLSNLGSPHREHLPLMKVNMDRLWFEEEVLVHVDRPQGRSGLSDRPRALALVSGDGASTRGSGLSSILNTLQEGANMHSVLKIVKEIKMSHSTYKKLLNFSPLVNQIIHEMSGKSPKIKITFDIIDGHIPTLMDLFHLLKTGHVVQVFKEVLAENKQFQELSVLMTKPDFEHSTTDIEQSISIITGHNLDISPAMVSDPRTGQKVVTNATDNKYRNLVEVFLMIHANWNQIMTTVDLIIEHNSELDKIVGSVLQMDLSHLNEISGLPTDGKKYSVSSSTGATDPEVAQIQQMYKSTKEDLKNSNNVHAYEQIMEAYTKIFDVLSRCMEQALI